MNNVSQVVISLVYDGFWAGLRFGGMEMLFGLPAHPLIVHFPVVGIPLVSIAALVVVLRPQKLAEHGWLVAGFSVLTAISTILAATSGEALVDLLNNDEAISRHRELGETLRLLSIVQALAISAMWVTSKKAELPKAVSMVLSAVAVIASVLALIWVIRTGHEGASQSWGFLS